MIWVTWRQHRAQAIACLVLFGALAALAVGFGIQMRTAFGQDGLPACLASSGGTGCVAALTSFVDRFARSGASSAILGVPLIAIPGLLGAVVGAPLLGRELTLVVGGLVVFGAAVSAVMAWYYEPLDRVTSRVEPGPFPGGGLTFPASLLCAFGLAVLAGLLLRNTIAAMVAGYVAWEIPTTVALLMNGPIHIPGPAVMRIPCRAGCPGASVGAVPPVTGHLGDYVLGVTRSGGELVVSYLPASRFWTGQFIQAGLYMAVAVITLGAATWLLHRRTT
jgi:hypothetical protein